MQLIIAKFEAFEELHINDKHLPVKTLIKNSWLAFPHGLISDYQPLDVLQDLVSYIKETAQYPSLCL